LRKAESELASPYSIHAQAPKQFPIAAIDIHSLPSIANIAMRQGCGRSVRRHARKEIAIDPPFNGGPTRSESSGYLPGRQHPRSCARSFSKWDGGRALAAATIVSTKTSWASLASAPTRQFVRPPCIGATCLAYSDSTCCFDDRRPAGDSLLTSASTSPWGPKSGWPCLISTRHAKIANEG
jgi:hypothetical protein